MVSDVFDSRPEAGIEVLLDGLPVRVPSGRRSLEAIRSYLDTLAFERQRILCSFHIDGRPVDLHRPLPNHGSFSRVEGESLDLEQLPLQLISTALLQMNEARKRVERGIVLVLINDGEVGRQYWWELTRQLKEPLLTLSLLPDNFCGAAGAHTSIRQLRRWQFEQLAAVLRDVDQACWTEDTRVLSNVLESRVLSWLDNLADSLRLLEETLLAGVRSAESRCQID